MRAARCSVPAGPSLPSSSPLCLPFPGVPAHALTARSRPSSRTSLETPSRRHECPSYIETAWSLPNSVNTAHPQLTRLDHPNTDILRSARSTPELFVFGTADRPPFCNSTPAPTCAEASSASYGPICSDKKIEALIHPTPSFLFSAEFVVGLLSACLCEKAFFCYTSCLYFTLPSSIRISTADAYGSTKGRRAPGASEADRHRRCRRSLPNWPGHDLG